MYPWRRILIPTDFSTASEWVFDDAVRIAGSTGAEIVILHVRMTRPSNPGELRFPADPSLYDYVEKVELEKLRGRLRRANATVPTRLLVRTAPDAGSEICHTAAAESADLVVMATHARHHVAHLLVGGTTQQVITNPPSAILAIRYGIQRRPAFRKIVVPLQPNESTSTALDLAAAIASREKSEVHLLTVCGAAERQAAVQLLAAIASSRLAGVSATRTVVPADDVAREIARYTEKSGADAVFLSAGRPSPLMLDIIRNASVPVMIVPGETTGGAC
jgi:nucleotide-binding universal stress UspA family protein